MYSIRCGSQSKLILIPTSANKEERRPLLSTASPALPRRALATTVHPPIAAARAPPTHSKVPEPAVGSERREGHNCWYARRNKPLVAIVPRRRGLDFQWHSLTPESNAATAMLDTVSMIADDFELAENLQVEEVLRFSTFPESVCAVCKQMIPSLDASWKPDNCDHVICIPCFCQYAPETETNGLPPRCMVASCESLCRSETFQGINACHGTLIEIDDDMDSGKGKGPLDGTLQEFGQCSRGANAVTSSNFYCSICMESVQTRELFPIAGCSHTFCAGCVGQYIAAKVEENVLSIGCPDPGCKNGALHPEACRDVIPAQVFQRWGAALANSALGALKFYCPFKDCSALLVDDPGHGEEAITNAECPHCFRMFCAQCRVAWHDGVTCAEFQRLGEDERGREDLLLRKVAEDSKWQRCPKCKMYVERVEGCVFIICRCGHCFCYLCASPMSRDNHHCKSCNRTY